MNFGKIPVEFVPPGMTAEEARRRRKRQMGPGRHDILVGVGSIVLLLLLCGGSAWYYVGRGRANEPTPANVALEPAQKTATVLAGLSIPSFTPTPSQTPLPSPMPLSTVLSPAVVSSTILSPVATPLPLLAQIVVSPTSTTPPPAKIAAAKSKPTNTPAPTVTTTTSPYDYQVIGHEIQPSDLYSYVSGWVVERDGRTPRPARVRLRFPTGEMLYPRPNNRDIADGHYEFLASPGRYWLEVDDGASPVVQIDIGDRERHEVSFKAISNKPLTAPARSSPWNAPPARSRPQIEPVVIAEMRYNILLPLFVGKDERRLYFPLLR